MMAVTAWPVVANDVPVKDLGRFQGWRDNALVGYGIVTGLSGSGDTRRNAVTRQALQNVLSRLGTNVTEDQISSRNVAVVIVTATLPASANVGDRIDVTVSSIGDARSLAGGTLLMTPLQGPDRQAYALAQGALVTSGYSFEANLNLQQRNYPTSAVLPGGATIERAVDARILRSDNTLSFVLRNPDFTTAQRISDTINQRFGYGTANVVNADEINIRFPGAKYELARFVSELENIAVMPNVSSKIVINERSGTVVAGGNVNISSVVISQGDIKISIRSENAASQPSFIGGFASDVSSLVITNTELDVDQGSDDAVVSFPNTTVGSLIQGLNRSGIDTRRMISILQAIKAAGALHAEIVVQ
ncbi:flagellar basal body P-ring protein FlgI [Sphingorhabdus sp. Alg239-R122]|uniref:flagellar basal body P-ring protein FlgI n=1 Tax=Sphingorhabdus sp. Alg239-R122 TaxID=2305989 RepID=UPI001F07AF5C|nr:flagellar basal body P-ring protein FlgI [Sphingorhabdus sp. Alg239-R122]